jgi:hypothetical protein
MTSTLRHYLMATHLKSSRRQVIAYRRGIELSLLIKPALLYVNRSKTTQNFTLYGFRTVVADMAILVHQLRQKHWETYATSSGNELGTKSDPDVGFHRPFTGSSYSTQTRVVINAFS